jgi:GntR family transcriptional repressor for pyruvate dehydrogenase complex
MSQLFDEIKRLNLSETIVQQVKQLILQGKLRAGHRLPSERLLAEQMGVGRSSVREAISALLALGIVEIRPGDGVFIRPDFPRSTIASVEWSWLMLNGHANDLIEARMAVEVCTARLAAERAIEAERHQLRSLIEQMAETDDLEAFINRDIQFHLTLAQASQNVVLREIITGIQPVMRGSMQQALQGIEARHRAVEQHCRLYLALEEGAAEKAEQIMRAHLSRDAAFFRQFDDGLNDLTAVTNAGLTDRRAK